MNKENWKRIIEEEFNEKKNLEEILKIQKKKQIKSNCLKSILSLFLILLLLIIPKRTYQKETEDKVNINNNLYINNLTSEEEKKLYNQTLDCTIPYKDSFLYSQEDNSNSIYIPPNLKESGKKTYIEKGIIIEKVTLYKDENQKIEIAYNDKESETTLRGCKKKWYKNILENKISSTIYDIKIITIKIENQLFITFNYNQGTIDILAENIEINELVKIIESIIKTENQ